MGERTFIEWCHHTFNPWWGCTKVSPACDHCYAERHAKRRRVGWGAKASRMFFGDRHWDEPLAWNRSAERADERRRVFCASMADVFEKRRELDQWREKLWVTILLTPALDWLLLTKRPELIDDMIPWGRSNTPPNVWLGTTVENQALAEERIPHLLRAPAARHFLSCEPLLGPIDFTGLLGLSTEKDLSWIDWVIVGGESGSSSRQTEPAWIRSIRDQCVDAGVSFFFKQWGEWAPVLDAEPPSMDGPEVLVRLGKKSAGRELDGRTWDEVPA